MAAKRMGLLDKMRADSRPGQHGCRVALILKRLDVTDRADLEAALDDTEITATAIGRVMTDAGYKVSEFQVRKHRGRGCSCGQPR